MIRATAAMRRGSLYELRTYKLHPEHFPAYMAATNEHFHLRTKHSELLGFWVTEIGGANEVFHVWRYASLSHRKKVRDALAADVHWNREYLGQIRPLLQSQQSMLATVEQDMLGALDVTTPRFYSLADVPPEGEGVKPLARFDIVISGEAPLSQLHLAASTDLDSLVGVPNSGAKFSKLMYPAPFSAKYCTQWQ